MGLDGMKFVDVETPYKGATEEEIKRNLLYARACVRDCLMRGEIPYASHLFFTQPGILDDNIPEERVRGSEAGKRIIEALPDARRVVYTDLGISGGMQWGIERAIKVCMIFEYRQLGEGWEERAKEFERRHSHAKVWGVH